MCKTVQILVNSNICAGCGQCERICPQGAISIKENYKGLLIPQIDLAKCDECGLCLKSCGNLEFDYSKYTDMKELILDGACLSSYVGISNNDETLENAQSGGVVAEIILNQIENGTIKYALGTYFSSSKGFLPEAIKIKDANDMKLSQGSIYLQNPINKYLPKRHSTESYIFIGTACHLRSLHKAIELKLVQEPSLKIGLLCKQTLNKKCIGYFAKRAGIDVNDIQKIRFKEKNRMIMKIQTINKSYYLKGYRGFLSRFMQPLACVYCPDKMNVLADISLGDSWGVPDYEGHSCIIVRNSKGEEVINQLINKNKIKCSTVSSQVIQVGQHMKKFSEDWISFISYAKEGGEIYPHYLTVNKSIKNESTNSYFKWLNKLYNKKNRKTFDSFLRRTILFARLKNRFMAKNGR